MSAHASISHRVPLVFHDLQASESLEQLLAALAQLESTTEAVFSRVESRVSAQRARISGLSGRVATAGSKVKAIAEKRQRQATTLFSTAKYPGKKRLPGFEALCGSLPYAGAPHEDPEWEDDDRCFQPPQDGGAASSVGPEELLDLYWRVNQLEHHGHSHAQTHRRRDSWVLVGCRVWGVCAGGVGGGGWGVGAGGASWKDRTHRSLNELSPLRSAPPRTPPHPTPPHPIPPLTASGKN